MFNRKMEYIIKSVPTDDKQMLEDLLNEMSSEGWDLYTMHEVESDEDFQYNCIFMRDKEPTEENESVRKAYLEELQMDTRVAVISIIIVDPTSVQAVNDILHQYSEYIIGRMGIPYRSRGINIISIAIDAPQDVINALSGKIGRLSGVSSKAAYSK